VQALTQLVDDYRSYVRQAAKLAVEARDP